jgi:hypothetical protein
MLPLSRAASMRHFCAVLHPAAGRDAATDGPALLERLSLPAQSMAPGVGLQIAPAIPGAVLRKHA